MFIGRKPDDKITLAHVSLDGESRQKWIWLHWDRYSKAWVVIASILVMLAMWTCVLDMEAKKARSNDSTSNTTQGQD